VISCRRIVAVVALAWKVDARTPAARVRLNAIVARTGPGGVGGEPPGRQVRESAALEVGDDLFDDGVVEVGGLGVELPSPESVNRS